MRSMFQILNKIHLQNLSSRIRAMDLPINTCNEDIHCKKNVTWTKTLKAVSYKCLQNPKSYKLLNIIEYI